MQQTSDGGYIITGSSYSYGAGGYDVYLIKADADGTVVWERTIGGSSTDVAFSVQQTSDGGYIVAGETNSYGAGNRDVYLIKTDSNGAVIWERTIGGSSDDRGYSVQQASDGGYIVAGKTNSYGAGSSDVYLIKTDSNGTVLWEETYGGTGYDIGYSVQQTSDGGYIITGSSYSYGAGGYDVYLIKTDPSGTSLWEKTFGGEQTENGRDVSQTSDGGYIVAGEARSFGSASWADIYLLKTDQNGCVDVDNDGHTTCDGDCNDYDSAINPSAPEVCDGIDNNCNSEIDEGFTDADSDGFAICNGDCNDADPLVNPSALEVCDGLDNNCDSTVDEGFDTDSDDYTICNGDCNDEDPAVNPSADEVCDGIDNNCDEQVDEGYGGGDEDADADGYRCADDCDDSDVLVNPGALEVVYNGKDDDCNENTPDYQWQTYSVDAVGGTGHKDAIGIDSSGNLHIYYCDDSGNQIMHGARNADGTWSTSAVADVCGYMAVDSSGSVHVSYYLAGEGLKYGTNASGSWASEVVDSSGIMGPIAVSSSGIVHIIYEENANPVYSIKHVTNDSASWVTETAYTMTCQSDCATSSSMTPFAIETDLSGKVHAVYMLQEPIYGTEYIQYVEYLTDQTGSWAKERIGTGGGGNCYMTTADIAVDSLGKAHIAYSASSDIWPCNDPYDRTTYATNTTGDWTNIPLDGNWAYPRISIAIDSLNNAHVFYGANFYTTNRTGSWLTEAIGYGATSSVCDSSGYVHGSYYLSGSSELYITNALPPDYTDDDGDGYSELEGDCDDVDPVVNPDAVEIWYDGTDQNCDGWNDYDQDMDGYVDSAWNAEAGGTSPGTDDCDDGNAILNPGTYWYPDNDGDGYGNPTISIQQCTQPDGYVLDNTDCNDDDPAVQTGMLPARVMGATTDYYTSPQAAYDAAADGETIQCREVPFSGNLIIDVDKAVTIECGYNCGYTAVTGDATINGDIIISSGTATLENIIAE